MSATVDKASRARTGAVRPVDAVALAQALVRCPSITPRDEGALDLVEAALTDLGFACRRMTFTAPGTATVDNLYARLGTAEPNFCFAGHTDVVPVGPPDAWSVDPFDAVVDDGVLFGRGAADMKGAIASFIAATARFLADTQGRFDGSISLMITGDEEGPAINGTRRMLEALAADGELPDLCLVGEPTNPGRLGDMIKIGRRGSLNGRITVAGHQGHVAYPHLARNPIPGLVKVLAALTAEPLDDGTEHFQPSNLEVTNVEVGNHATNVIPGQAEAMFNIRFNDLHTPDGLMELVRARCASAGVACEVEFTLSGDAFVTPPGPLSDAISQAVAERLGREPELSTTGGTSDARFIKNYCPVAEFGLVGATMHKADEQVAVADIAALTDIYTGVLHRIFRP